MRKIYFSIAVAVLTLFVGFSHSDVSGNFLFTENIEKYYKMGVWNEQNEFGVRIGDRVIRHEIYNMKTYDLLRVDNARIEAIMFRYRGLDLEENNLKLKYRVEKTKHNSQVWAGSSSRYMSFEYTWDVWMALNLRVEDGEFAYKPTLTKTDKGYEAGPDWWLDDMVKKQFELFGLIAQNDNPDKQTEIILRWPYKISNLGRYYDDILTKNRCVTQLRESGVIQEKDIRFDKEGVWFIYSYDPENFTVVHDLVFRDTCSIDSVMAGE